MLTALNNILNNFKSSITAIDAVLDEFGETVADRKRVELRAGLSGKGGNITPSYSPFYGAWKNSLKTYQAPNGTPDTYVTGTYHNSILYTRKGYEFYYGYSSTQPYFSDLEDQYDGLREISPQGSEDLDNKLAIRIDNAFQKIWN